MPVIFGRDIGTARFSARVNLTTERSAAFAVPQGATEIIWQLDDAQFTSPTEQFQMTVEWSTDNQASWRMLIGDPPATYTGGVKARDGSPPSGLVPVPPGATHIRVTAWPTAGTPRVGIFGTVQ